MSVAFQGRLFFCSNFYTYPVTVYGRVYASAEHAYQAFKMASAEDHESVRSAPTPGQAKRLGRRLQARPHWDTEKVDVMRHIVRAKFRDPHLMESLLATGDEELVEENEWGDRFWGRVNGDGENWLGRILMEVRADGTAKIVAG